MAFSESRSCSSVSAPPSSRASVEPTAALPTAALPSLAAGKGDPRGPSPDVLVRSWFAQVVPSSSSYHLHPPEVPTSLAHHQQQRRQHSQSSTASRDALKLLYPKTVTESEREPVRAAAAGAAVLGSGPLPPRLDEPLRAERTPLRKHSPATRHVRHTAEHHRTTTTSGQVPSAELAPSSSFQMHASTPSLRANNTIGGPPGSSAAYYSGAHEVQTPMPSSWSCYATPGQPAKRSSAFSAEQQQQQHFVSASHAPPPLGAVPSNVLMDHLPTDWIRQRLLALQEETELLTVELQRRTPSLSSVPPRQQLDRHYDPSTSGGPQYLVGGTQHAPATLVASPVGPVGLQGRDMSTQTICDASTSPIQRWDSSPQQQTIARTEDRRRTVAVDRPLEHHFQSAGRGGYVDTERSQRLRALASEVAVVASTRPVTSSSVDAARHRAATEEVEPEQRQLPRRVANASSASTAPAAGDGVDTSRRLRGLADRLVSMLERT